MTESLTRRGKKIRRSRSTERTLGAIAIILIILAWLIGNKLENAEVEPFLGEAFAEAEAFERISANEFAAYGATGSQELLGYVGIGEANGYGGPLKLAVAVDLKGNVLGLALIKHRETRSWFEEVTDSGLLENLIGKNYQDPFQLGDDLDGVTGATYTSRAIVESVMEGSRLIAGDQLGFEVPAEAKPHIVFGVPELSLIALFAIGYFGHQSDFKFKKQLRWAGLLAGLLILGFIYNLPLTLSQINKFLLGFWPQWQTNLYWYLLMGGILLVFTVDNKNPYCYWFCPFGAAQECLGTIGRAKVYSPGRYRHMLKWLRRGVVWFCIIVALLFRSPGLTSYEVFGTLFSLLGSNSQFLLLGLVLVAALFIKRPWCTYLCPLDPVVDFISMTRKWIIELWRRTQLIRTDKRTS